MVEIIIGVTHKVICYKEWEFELAEKEPIFGKLKIIAQKEEVEEVFFVYAETLTEQICEDLYKQYLYIYG